MDRIEMLRRHLSTAMDADIDINTATSVHPSTQSRGLQLQQTRTSTETTTPVRSDKRRGPEPNIPQRVRQCSSLVLDTPNQPAAAAAAANAKWIPYLERCHVNCTPDAIVLIEPLAIRPETRKRFRRVVASIGPQESYNVLDLHTGISNDVYLGDLAVGRWDEDRQNMYTSEIFEADTADARTIHIGCDLFDAAGTPVCAFYDGEIFLTGHYPGAGDYGFVVVLKHVIDGRPVWSLHGHLQPESVKNKKVGQKIAAGDVIGWIGCAHDDVNGGWVPHLHFQLTLLQPRIADWPGVVAPAHRALAKQVYPDPRHVLGPLWQ